MQESKFIRIKVTDFEVAINLERVNQVLKSGELTAIYFSGDPEPAKLKGAAAESFWRHVETHSLCIHPGHAKNQGEFIALVEE